ncbi:hypothetical protein MNV49_001373 [Pseudohyphozyma bogoriensis]|nr:hypothetical protein MNV49_001373 [Pseudohyphozyma bogoriensis]
MAPSNEGSSAPDGTGYGKIRSPLDQQAVDKYLAAHVEGFKAPSDIKQFTFGQSNPTYFVTSASGSRYVLRKKPAGALVSKTAHAIEREYQIIDAIGKTGKIPVPKMYCLCMDESVLGTPFYVMEYLEGRIFTDVRMPQIESKEERAKCWMDIVRVLAELHKLKPSEIGLGQYGSTKPFYPRQIRSLTKVSQAQAAVKDVETGEEVGLIPEFDWLVKWYGENCPSGGGWEGSIVHGDFKCDNMIFHPTKPIVIGVLDWELSTLGHPLSDLANLLQPFSIPSIGPQGTRPTSLVPLRGIPEDDLPIPSDTKLIQAYCRQVGMPYPLKGWNAAVSFAFFRLAVITQGIAARAARGQASSADAKRHASLFKPLGYLAVERAKEGEQDEVKAKL